MQDYLERQQKGKVEEVLVHKRPVRKITEVADSKHLNWGCGSCNVREVDGKEERREG